jgi:acyl-CoA synthetase (AMP-forming)/AMP-acid ligase II
MLRSVWAAIVPKMWGRSFSQLSPGHHLRPSVLTLYGTEIMASNSVVTARRRLAQISSQLSPNSTKASFSTGPTIQTSPSSSPERPSHFHDLNPTYFLPRAASVEPNARAIVHKSATGRRVTRTYQEMADRVMYLAYYFKSKGYKRVAILAPNTPAHLETMYASVAAGGITQGLNYRLSKNEIHYKIELGQADLVIADKEFAHLTEGLPRHVSVIVDSDVGVGYNPKCQYEAAILQGKKIAADSSKNGWADLHCEDAEENDLLGLFFTSGTTGKPKAVEYTHRGVYLASLANVIEAGLNCQGVYGEDRCHYLWTLPMFHAAGWTYPYAVTSVRGTHFCLRKVDPDYIWDLLINEKITHFNAAPTVNTMILNSPRAQRLPKLVRVIVAASPPSAKLFEDMIDLNLFPVHMYGLTETYGPFTRIYFREEWKDMPKEKHFELLARQGLSFLTSAAVRVVKDTSSELAADYKDVEKNGLEIGEIICRGNIVAKGYHRNPEETDKSFGGWFKSGDLAVVHPDGNIQILDRKKDIIISGGENISSVAVESVIVRYPNILEAAVVGIKDSHYGEVPIAFCTLRDKTKPVDLDTLRKWMKSETAGYNVPKRFILVDQLPKTSTGKIRKNVLRDEVSKSS